jgi:hypothetical protein
VLHALNCSVQREALSWKIRDTTLEVERLGSHLGRRKERKKKPLVNQTFSKSEMMRVISMPCHSWHSSLKPKYKEEFRRSCRQKA